jgi:hypothetical protein
MRVKKKNRQTTWIWMGSIYALPDVKVFIYVNEKFSYYWAVIKNDYLNSEKEIKTRSFNKLMKNIKRELINYPVVDSSKALWFDRFVWSNKPLHQYVMEY